MITIKMLRDDEGLARLKRDDQAPRISKEVNAITHYPTIEPSMVEGRLPSRARLYTHPKENLTPRRARKTRGTDRRNGQDRRQQNKPVLLDTRSQYPRRTRDRRLNTTVRRRGINLYS